MHESLALLFAELTDGPSPDAAYMLNAGDPGLLRSLDALSAEAASRQPAPGAASIAAHVDHLCYGLELMNRWGDGEADPWSSADWTASSPASPIWPTIWAPCARSTGPCADPEPDQARRRRRAHRVLPRAGWNRMFERDVRNRCGAGAAEPRGPPYQPGGRSTVPPSLSEACRHEYGLDEPFRQDNCGEKRREIRSSFGQSTATRGDVDQPAHAGHLLPD